MTYAEIVDNIAHRQLLTKKTTRVVIEAFIAEVRDAVVREGRVSIPGLGVFHVRTRSARRVLNPETNMPMTLPPRRIVTCRIAGSWRTVSEGTAALQSNSQHPR